jgi:hypothetical protein
MGATSKGIHDVSFILGVEASRDIEVTTFQGVSGIAYMRLPIRLCSLDHACRSYVHRNCSFSQDRACPYIASWSGHDRRYA